MKKHTVKKHRYPLTFWFWGSRTEFYPDLSKAPHWVRNNGQLVDPCDVAGCKRWVDDGEWYIRHPFLGVVCSRCAPRFGAVLPTENA